MTTGRKTKRERRKYYEERSEWWLVHGNELSEKGKKMAAEEAYQKSARFLMRANELLEWQNNKT